MDEWQEYDNALVREFEFASFPAAIAFVDGVAVLAQSMDHHPDIDVRYVTVRLALTTHDQGGLTTLDLELAARVALLLGGATPP